MRDDVMWSDGEPLTAADVAYTYGRVLDGGPEAATWSSYLIGVESVEAPDDTTVVITLKKPNAVLPLLPIPIVPEHVWKDVSEKDVKSFANEPKDGEPVVGSGPFRFVEGTAGGSTYRFEANPDYWKGAPHIDEVVFRVYKSEDPMVQALIKGEVDFVEGISALQVQSLESQDSIIAHNGDSPGFDEIAFNTGLDRHRHRRADGRPQPGRARPEVPVRAQLRHRPRADHPDGLPGRRAARRGDHPAVVRRLRSGCPTIPMRSPSTSTRPPSCSTRPATPWVTTASAPCPNGDPIGKLRLAARSDSPTSLDVMEFFQEWLADARHRLRGRDLRVEQAHRRHPRG